MSDLTFMEDGNPDFTENGLINWLKRSLLYTVLSQFLEFQRLAYFDFADTDELARSLLGSINSLQESASKLYDISLQLEPRGGEPPERVSHFPFIFFYFFLFFLFFYFWKELNYKL